MADNGMAQPAFGQRIERMRIAAGVERIGQELRIVVVADDDAVLREHHGVELDVEADLQDAGRFQQRTQRLDGVGGVDLVRCEAAANRPAPSPDALWASGI